MANEKNQPEKVPGQDIPPGDRTVGPKDGGSDRPDTSRKDAPADKQPE